MSSGGHKYLSFVNNDMSHELKSSYHIFISKDTTIIRIRENVNILNFWLTRKFIYYFSWSIRLLTQERLQCQLIVQRLPDILEIFLLWRAFKNSSFIYLDFSPTTIKMKSWHNLVDTPSSCLLHKRLFHSQHQAFKISGNLWEVSGKSASSFMLEVSTRIFGTLFIV